MLKKKAPIMPELVPAPLWGRSASQMLKGKAAWKTIRQDALSESKDACKKCGGTNGQLSCHDIWKYDDKRGIATLIGFEIHCSPCDSVAHAGRAIKMGYGEMMIGHLCMLNGWEPDHAFAVLQEAMDIWERRSQKKWRIAVAPSLLKRYPELAELPKFQPSPAAY